MDILDSIDASEVPDTGRPRFGVWTGLAQRAIADHDQGKVTVIRLNDRTEYRRMANGTADTLRKAGYKRRFVPVDNPDGSVTAYLQLEAKQINGRAHRPARSGIRAVRQS